MSNGDTTQKDSEVIVSSADMQNGRSTLVREVEKHLKGMDILDKIRLTYDKNLLYLDVYGGSEEVKDRTPEGLRVQEYNREIQEIEHSITHIESGVQTTGFLGIGSTKSVVKALDSKKKAVEKKKDSLLGLCGLYATEEKEYTEKRDEILRSIVDMYRIRLERMVKERDCMQIHLNQLHDKHAELVKSRMEKLSLLKEFEASVGQASFFAKFFLKGGIKDCYTLLDVSKNTLEGSIAVVQRKLEEAEACITLYSRRLDSILEQQGMPKKKFDVGKEMPKLSTGGGKQSFLPVGGAEKKEEVSGGVDTGGAEKRAEGFGTKDDSVSRLSGTRGADLSEVHRSDSPKAQQEAVEHVSKSLPEGNPSEGGSIPNTTLSRRSSIPRDTIMDFLKGWNVFSGEKGIDPVELEDFISCINEYKQRNGTGEIRGMLVINAVRFTNLLGQYINLKDRDRRNEDFRECIKEYTEHLTSQHASAVG